MSPAEGHGAHPTSQPPGGAPRRAPGSGGLNRMPKGDIGTVLAVGSGKGGVGKSSMTALLACELARQGHKVGILDADVTGPSIPKLFGQSGPLLDKGEGIEPASSVPGIATVSSQFLVETSDTPVVWRGPLVTRLILQFFGGVHWGKLDYLLLDMPPGTSDVPLTVFQTIPIDGMVFVSTPQDLSSLIVRKAMLMARELHVPLLGLIDNMAYAKCPHCGERIEIYGKDHVDSLAKDYDVPILATLPIATRVSELADEGKIYEYTSPEVTQLTQALLQSLKDVKSRTLTVL